MSSFEKAQWSIYNVLIQSIVAKVSRYITYIVSVRGHINNHINKEINRCKNKIDE